MVTDLAELIRVAPNVPDAWYGIRDELVGAGRWDWPNVRALVLEHKAAEWPRLLAADWFESTGQSERAEFVRVGHEIANIRAAGTADPRRYADPVAGRYDTPPELNRLMVLEVRANGLLLDHAREWFTLPSADAPKYPAACGGPYNDVVWFPGNTGVGEGHPADLVVQGMTVRGFVEEVGCSFDVWCHFAPLVLAEQPIRRVGLGVGVPETESRHTGIGGREVRVRGMKKWHPSFTPFSKMLEVEWPGVVFVTDGDQNVAPVEPRPRYTFRVGDLVSAGGDGRLVPCPGGERSLAVGEYLGMVHGADEDTHARVRLFDLFRGGSTDEVPVEIQPVPDGTVFNDYPTEPGFLLEPGDPVTLRAWTGWEAPYRVRPATAGASYVGFVQRVNQDGTVRVRMLPKPELFGG